MTLSITTPSIMRLFATLSITILCAVVLTVAIYFCCADCRYTECHYAECRYAECHYAECNGAQKADEIF